MAYSVTLANLRTAALEQADEEGYGYIGDTTANRLINRLINRSWARLWARLIQAAEDDYTTTGTVTTVAGQEAYSLPSDFLKLRHAEVDLGGIKPIRLRRFLMQEHHLLSGSWNPGQMIAYRIVGADSIRFLPVPSGAHTVTLFYIPAPSVLAVDGDTIDVRSGWDDWITYDVVAKIAMKQEADASTALAMRDDCWRNEIEPLVGTQDENDPERVQDTEGDQYFDDGSW